MPLKVEKTHPDKWARMKHPHPHHVGHAPHIRASGRMERYHPDDGRVHHEACHHTQILDISASDGIVRCLDCGHVLDVKRAWAVVDEPPLKDSELLEHRIRFNDFHFDKLYKLMPNHDDDPELDKKINKSLAAQGAERITPDHVAKHRGN